MHECKHCKSDKIRDVCLDNRGVFTCKSCGKELEITDVHPESIELSKNKK